MARKRRRQRVRRVFIGDRRWRIQHCKCPADRDGDCNWDLRRIRVHHTLEGRDLMRVLIHEILHARLWDIDEAAIDEAGEVLSAVLDAEGFKQPDDHEED